MTEEIQLLKEASFEIKSLRRRNELMGARLDMFDQMMLLFQSAPNYRSEGMSPDVVFTIDKFVRDKEIPEDQK